MVQTSLVKALDPQAAHEEAKGEIRQALLRVLEAGPQAATGEVEALEAGLGRWLGLAQVRTVAGGTEALDLALRACGVGPGDGVVVDAFCEAPIPAALARLGARALRVDVEADTLTMDPGALKARLADTTQPKPRAVIVTHRAGHPAAMPAVMAVARAHDGLPVIEDCAQALGGAWESRRLGAFGDLATYCFGPGRSLAALGRAGAVATTDPALGDRLARLRDAVLDCGLDEVQAAVLRAQLRGLDGAILRRQSIALRYDSALVARGIRVPVERLDATHSYTRYLIRVANPDPLRAALANLGLEPEALHPLPQADDPALPVAVAAARTAIALPVYAQLPADHQKLVLATIAATLG